MNAVVGLIEIEDRGEALLDNRPTRDDATLEALFGRLVGHDSKTLSGPAIGARNRVQQLLSDSAHLPADLNRLAADLDAQTPLLVARIAKARAQG
jgi:hypothetical protein